MSFVYELPYAVYNGHVNGCCHIEFGSTCLLCKPETGSVNRDFKNYKEKPTWVIWLVWAIVGQYTDKMTQKYVKNESFCPCSDPLWLKWVKWLIWFFCDSVLVSFENWYFPVSSSLLDLVANHWHIIISHCSFLFVYSFLQWFGWNWSEKNRFCFKLKSYSHYRKVHKYRNALHVNDQIQGELKKKKKNCSNNKGGNKRKTQFDIFQK